MPELADELYHDLKRAVHRLLRRQRRRSAGGTAAWTRPARRSASRWTARPREDRTVTVRDRDSMQQERVGLDQVAGYAGASAIGRGLTARMRLSDFEAMVRRHGRRGAAPSSSTASPRSSVSPRTRARIPTRAEHLHARRVHPAPGRRTAPGRRASRAGSCCTTARSPRSPRLDAGLRLAGRGLGDADPRAAAPPRVARPRARPRGLRLGGRAELRPAGRRAVRSALLPRRRAPVATDVVPGGGRRLPRPDRGARPDAVSVRWWRA